MDYYRMQGKLRSAETWLLLHVESKTESAKVTKMGMQKTKIMSPEEGRFSENKMLSEVK